jgi:hypothetical protein
MQISTIKNQNLEKPSRNPSKRTIVKILRKKILGYLSKKIWFRVCTLHSHRLNVRTSKFWRKSKETKRNFFRKIYQGLIRIWFRRKKNSKISHACVPLSRKIAWTRPTSITVNSVHRGILVSSYRNMVTRRTGSSENILLFIADLNLVPQDRRCFLCRFLLLSNVNIVSVYKN